MGKVCRCWEFPSSFFLAGGKYVYCSCDGKAMDVHLLLHCEEVSQGQRARSILMIIMSSDSPLYLLIWVKLPWQSPSTLRRISVVRGRVFVTVFLLVVILIKSLFEVVS